MILTVQAFFTFYNIYDKRLQKPHTNCLSRSSFFSVRVINDWNSLSQSVINACSTNQFKNLLDRYQVQTASYVNTIKKAIYDLFSHNYNEVIFTINCNYMYRQNMLSTVSTLAVLHDFASTIFFSNFTINRDHINTK